MRRYGWNGQQEPEWESEAYERANVKPGDIVEAFGYVVASYCNPYLVLSRSDPDVDGARTDCVWLREQGVVRFDAEPCPPDLIGKKIS